MCSFFFLQREQLDRHRERLEEIKWLRAELSENAPPLKAKGKAVYAYFYRQRYFEREVSGKRRLQTPRLVLFFALQQLRYKTYIDVLNRNIAPASQTTSRLNVNGTTP